MDVIPVELGARSYPVVIADGLAGLGPAVVRALGTGPAVLIGSAPLLERFGAEVLASLAGAGMAATPLGHPDGEQAKQLGVWAALVEAALGAGLRRGVPVIALGGGVTGDLAGFVAASANRGVPFVGVPTSLLAMVDSAVGGKVGINSALGKNLIGAFHQPSLVYAALGCLASLPADQLQSGLGEVIKHALLQGPEAVARLERAAPALARGERAAWAAVIGESIRYKASIVAADEREGGLRAILNLGHTAGHAIEAALEGSVPHGICVYWGLGIEARFAADRGLGAPELPRAVQALGAALGLPKFDATIPTDTLFQLMQVDKKRARATLALPIIAADGRPALVSLDAAALRELAELASSPEDPCARRSPSAP
jgi:3-dehydroquinate synthase